MQDYIDLAKKNGFTLLNSGNCQFCGAKTKRGIHECIEIFNFDFDEVDFSNPKNHIYKFLVVDAHTLQHSEIHGRWNNHFHLSRLHLIFKYNVVWTYKLSPKLSDSLNKYKSNKQDEYLIPPKVLERGKITSSDVINCIPTEVASKNIIKEWALDVYNAWSVHYKVVDSIAKSFLNEN